jgi:AcrR family transcriptional regulator
MARRRLDAEESRTLILDAAERLMRRDGYGAVNGRSIAIEAGMKPQLVHYHFATTENLMLAFYLRSAERSEALLAAALASKNPLRAIWEYNADPHRTALAAEFMALANHRHSIREAMTRNVEKFRTMQTAALQQALETDGLGKLQCPPEVAAMIIAAVGRAFVMEQSIGISTGHAATRAFVETLFKTVETA